MSLLLRNIGGLLDEYNIGTVGTDLYIEKLPADPANAILLVSITSPEPDMYLDTQYLDFEVWIRNKSVKTGSDVATSIYQLLHRHHHLTLGDYFIYFIHAQSNIDNFDEDSEGRRLLKQSYRAIYRDTRTVS